MIWPNLTPVRCFTPWLCPLPLLKSTFFAIIGRIILTNFCINRFLINPPCSKSQNPFDKKSSAISGISFRRLSHLFTCWITGCVVKVYFVDQKNRNFLLRTTTTRTKEIRELGENSGNDADCRMSTEQPLKSLESQLDS